LVVVTQINPMTVIFTVTEDDISKVTARLATGAVLPVTVYDRTNSTKIADGKLGSVDNQVDTSTGTVKLRAVFDNRDGKLFPNNSSTRNCLWTRYRMRSSSRPRRSNLVRRDLMFIWSIPIRPSPSG